jgi:hypothetical protein
MQEHKFSSKEELLSKVATNYSLVKQSSLKYKNAKNIHDINGEENDDEEGILTLFY